NQLKVVGAVDPAGEQSLIGAQVHMAVVLQGRIDQSDLPQFIHIFAEGGMEVDHRDPVVQSQPQVVVHILKKGKYRIVAESLGLVDVVDQTTLCIQVIEAVGYTAQNKTAIGQLNAAVKADFQGIHIGLEADQSLVPIGVKTSILGDQQELVSHGIDADNGSIGQFRGILDQGRLSIFNGEQPLFGPLEVHPISDLMEFCLGRFRLQDLETVLDQAMDVYPVQGLEQHPIFHGKNVPKFLILRKGDVKSIREGGVGQFPGLPGGPVSEFPVGARIDPFPNGPDRSDDGGRGQFILVPLVAVKFQKTGVVG